MSLKFKQGIYELITAFSILAICTIYTGQKKEVLDENKLVQAIYRQEGSSHTRYPFGIKSVPCSTKMECQAICLRTVRHQWKNFTRDGHKGIKAFICYLGPRFVCGNDGICPESEGWILNVNSIYYRRS